MTLTIILLSFPLGGGDVDDIQEELHGMLFGSKNDSSEYEDGHEEEEYYDEEALANFEQEADTNELRTVIEDSLVPLAAEESVIKISPTLSVPSNS